MTRAQYARYLLARIAESAAVAAGAVLLAHILERLGYMAPFCGRQALQAFPSGAVSRLLWWAKPALLGASALVLLGPKQKRPVYLRLPGAMYAYAGITVDRNAGCRGGCITGATGSGKTLACILPRLHSLCVNEAGVERRTWKGSAACLALEQERAAHDALALMANEHPGSGAWTELARSTCALRALADTARSLRYRSAPWGGFICGEKGNEWKTVELLLRHHRRIEDLCIVATRPPGAPPQWMPPVRFNLLSMEEIPADTYAKMIVETGLCVEEAQTRDEFFVPQARDKIAWGLRLTRAVGECRRAASQECLPGEAPSLSTLFEILTVQESYRRYLVACTTQIPTLTGSQAFCEARFQLENNYWNQPADQLGGVRSTVYNFLAPFCEAEVAEVFCSDSTFDLRDIQKGKVVTLAIPQKYALQRRYIATLLKTLTYQIVLERFDHGSGHCDSPDRNVVLVEQDEWQRHAVRADCDVDVVREARGAVYAATQSQNAVWLKLGGKDNAAPMIANLRNRWICQAATEECAEESSALVSGRMSRQLSYSHGAAGRTTTVSFSEQPLLPRRALRNLRPFHVIFAPAEGRWLYRSCIAMPATADCKIPRWWFGDWNPTHWIAAGLGLPERLAGIRLRPPGRLVPPWRASAPLRAQLRWLFGLDGTFIVTGGRRTNDASG